MAKKKAILSTAVNNETLTEDLIVNWLNTEENIHAPKDNDVKFARQYPLGNRRPDFVTIYKEDGEHPICIIIEAKHNNLDAAEKQVKEYMELVNSSNKNLVVIGIGASLNTRKTLKLSGFWKKGDNEIQILKTKQDLNYLVSQTKDVAKAVKIKKQKIEGWRDKLSYELSQLHEHVRNYCAISGDSKMNLIFGTFIALKNENFRKNINKYQDVNYSRNIFNAIVSVMMAESHDMDQIQNIKDAFAFLDIDTLPINKLTVPSSILGDVFINESEISFSRFICNYVENFILQPIRKLNDPDCTASDVGSAVYNEFLKYNKSDAQTLGIVLTPEHIADLMTELINLNPDDVLLDICTGSGAFLISGMKKKLNHSNNGEEEEKCLTGLVGIELQNHMYAAALSNMLFNEADISNLHLGSCYEEKIIDKIKKLNPTKAILNPPYAMYKNDRCEKNLNEWGFVKHALDFLPKGGKCACIVPTSCGIKDGIFAEYRDLILNNNRLDAVIECNPKLFVPAAPGAITSIFIFTAGVPHEKSSSLYIDAKDDGFKSGKRGSSLDSSKWGVLKNKIIKDVNNDESSEISRHFKTGIGKTWDFNENLEFELYYEDFGELKPFSIAKIINEEEQKIFYYLSNGNFLTQETFISKFLTVAYKSFYKNILINEDYDKIHFNVHYNSKYLILKDDQLIMLNDKANKKLDTSSWKSFKIVDLFDIKRGSGLVTKTGKYPQVTASSKNNGVTGLSNEKSGENQITCSANGAPGCCFYQKGEFSANSDVIILTHKNFKMTEKIGLFLSVVMTKIFTPKYSYGKKLGNTRLLEESIFLPVKDNNPDWEYMEEFMNNLIEKE